MMITEQDLEMMEMELPNSYPISCPYCGEVFSSFLLIPGSLRMAGYADEVGASALYSCESCSGQIEVRYSYHRTSTPKYYKDGDDPVAGRASKPKVGSKSGGSKTKAKPKSKAKAKRGCRP